MTSEKTIKEQVLDSIDTQYSHPHTALIRAIDLAEKLTRKECDKENMFKIPTLDVAENIILDMEKEIEIRADERDKMIEKIKDFFDDTLIGNTGDEVAQRILTDTVKKELLNNLKKEKEVKRDGICS